jgi:hypothetical protein
MTARLTLRITHVSGRALAVAALLSLLLAAPFSGRLLLGSGSAGSRALAPGAGAQSQSGLWSLTPAARASISAALGADDDAYRIVTLPAGLQAFNPAQDLSAVFARSGLLLASRTLRLGVSLSAVGYGDSLRKLESVTPRATRNRVTYSHAGVSEWYVNGPLGIEQGFTLARAPAGRAPGPLTLAMTLSGDARLALAGGGDSATASAGGADTLRYGGLSATDAHGRALTTWLTLAGRRLLLHVDTRGASFPLTVDPLIETQPEAKLTSEEATEHGRSGMSVALSGDGQTALVGAPWEDGGTGAAWVFTRSEAGWVQSGPKLAMPEADSKIGDCGNETPEEAAEEGEPPATGADQCRFGRAVAVNGDGSMLAIGAPRANSDAGAVWIYTRSGSTWTETSELASPGGGSSWFGRSVAVSADGDTVLVGAPQASAGTGGEAWVFTAGSSGWEAAGPLVGEAAEGEGSFGRSVALAADGETALVGAPGIERTQGAAWVFAKSGSSWSGRGARLTGGGGAAEVGFGSSVALSGEGATALVGAPGDDRGVGAAWVFTNSGSSWTEQTSMLTGPGGEGEEFGDSVALSSDGTRALIGAAGAIGKRGDALLFESSGASWGEAHARLTGGVDERGSGEFGSSVALSSDAETLLAGGRSENRSGAAWVFGPYPSISEVAPHKGPSVGGTPVEIKGEHIDTARAVRFGSNEAESFKVEPDEPDGEERIIAVSPRGTGTVDIRVETPIGTSAPTELDRFTYKSGSSEGGGGGEGEGKGGGGGEGGGKGGGGGGTGGTGSGGGGTGATGGEGGTGTGGTVGLSGGAVLAFGPVSASACTVSLLSRKIAVKSHGLALFKLRGAGTARCAGKLKLTIKRKVTNKKYRTKVIGTASFSIAPGKNVAVKVTLDAAGRALLKAAHGRLGASLLLVKSSPAPSQAHTASVRLTQQKPRPPKKT